MSQNTLPIVLVVPGKEMKYRTSNILRIPSTKKYTFILKDGQAKTLFYSVDIETKFK